MNRSNPLPIHQFPCLIDEVRELKELEAKIPGEYRLNELDSIGNVSDSIISESDGIFDEIIKVRCFAHQNAGQYQVRKDTSKFLIGLRNAAPKLLDVLDFRAGDAEILHWMLTGEGDDHTQEEINDMLHRYRDMAQAMEGSL